MKLRFVGNILNLKYGIRVEYYMLDGKINLKMREKAYVKDRNFVAGNCFCK